MSKSAFQQSQSPYASELNAGLVRIATEQQVGSGDELGPNGEPLVVGPKSAALINSVQVTAGENLTKGQTVFLANGTEVETAVSQPNVTDFNNSLSTTFWRAQAFTIPASLGFTTITTITIYTSANSPGAFLVLELRDSLSGAPLFSQSLAQTTTMTYTLNYAFIPDQEYFIIVRGLSNITNFHIATGDPYPQGDSYTSSNSGVTWTLAAGVDIRFVINGTGNLQGGKVYRASASTNFNITRTNNYIGLVIEDVDADETAFIRTSGVVGGLTGLTPAGLTFLGNGLGEVSATAGNRVKRVGLALNSTTLLVRDDNLTV